MDETKYFNQVFGLNYFEAQNSKPTFEDRCISTCAFIGRGLVGRVRGDGM